jgi:hypothetical protein
MNPTTIINAIASIVICFASTFRTFRTLSTFRYLSLLLQSFELVALILAFAPPGQRLGRALHLPWQPCELLGRHRLLVHRLL